VSSAEYDHALFNPYPTDDVLAQDRYEYGHRPQARDEVAEHPCLAIKKLLGDGTFYYSTDFDLTNRLQNRFAVLGMFKPNLTNEIL
jgi:hypothetical protein